MAGVRLSRRAFVLLLVVASAHAGKTSLKEWLLSHNHGNERLTDKVLVALEKEDVFDLGDLTALTALPRFSELEFGARMSDKTVRKWLHSVANSVLSSDTSDRDEPAARHGTPPPTTEATRVPALQPAQPTTSLRDWLLASLNNDAGLADKVQAVLEGEDVFSVHDLHEFATLPRFSDLSFGTATPDKTLRRLLRSRLSVHESSQPLHARRLHR